MLKFVLIASLLVCAALAAPARDDDVDLEEQRRMEDIQNQSAQYTFSSKVNDDINDSQTGREETREGGKVKGFYSYSDGFVRRKVFYEADENGYRVVKEEMENIGEGPVFNEHGVADVEGSLIGRYSIKLDKDDEEKHYKDARA